MQLVFVLGVAAAICSGISHLAVRHLKIYATYAVPQFYGRNGNGPSAILHSSSLGYSGVDWEKIAADIGEPIKSWATAGSSPAEWDVLSQHFPRASRTFIAVSAYDLNEYWLCDFRADIVPLGQSLSDLAKFKADWQFSKRLLSQYPMAAVRKPFPTVGRSDGVMTGIRDELAKILPKGQRGEEHEGTNFGSAGAPGFDEKLTNWSPGRLQRRLALMRTLCQGKHSFNGPKKLALIRLLQRVGQQGEVVLIVMPVSPVYQKEFLAPEVATAFEHALVEVENSCPAARVVRLDRIDALESDDKFRDFVHLNTDGQHIATAAFLTQLDKQVSQR